MKEIVVGTWNVCKAAPDAEPLVRQGSSVQVRMPPTAVVGVCHAIRAAHGKLLALSSPCTRRAQDRVHREFRHGAKLMAIIC